MPLSTILHPLPSTHAHTQRHHSSSQPSPGHLPHASTLPTALDASSHKHYQSLHASPSHTHSVIPSIHPRDYISKHTHEYTVQHSFRNAKHEARGSIDTAIPELLPVSSLPPGSMSSMSSSVSSPPTNKPIEALAFPMLPNSSSNTAVLTAEPLELDAPLQASVTQQERDRLAWEAVLHSREAARRRSTIDGEDLVDNNGRPHISEYQKMSETSVRTEGSRD